MKALFPLSLCLALLASSPQLSFGAEAASAPDVKQQLESLKKENESLKQENQILRKLLLEKTSASAESAPASAPVAQKAPVTSYQKPPARATSQPSPAATKGFWLSASGKRHNSNCRYYMSSKGRACTAAEGTACKACGG